MNTFKVGQVINHESLGIGKVIEVTHRKGPLGNNDLDIVKVEFPEMEREISHVEYISTVENKLGYPYNKTVVEKVNWTEFTEVSLAKHLVKEEM